VPAVAPVQETPAEFGGPASVEAQLRSDEASKASLFRPRAIPSVLRSYVALKDRLRGEYGLSYGMDYNLLYQHADKSLGAQNAAGGVLRLFGTWTVFDQASAHPGAIEFKVEDRHRLGTEVAPASLAGQIGYAGLTAVPFSDAGTILTNLYWHQSFWDNRLAYILGIVDVTDYVGVYGLVNPWTDFINLAFSTDPTTPAPDQGFGAAVRWNPAEQYYVLAGLADANGNPRDPVDSVDGFFNDGEYFKHTEVGWFGSWESRLDDNIHLTYWHADERTEADVPDGWGCRSRSAASSMRAGCRFCASAMRTAAGRRWSVPSAPALPTTLPATIPSSDLASTGAVRTAPASAPPATTNTPWRPTTAFSSSSAWRSRPTCNWSRILL
jgi:porin